MTRAEPLWTGAAPARVAHVAASRHGHMVGVRRLSPRRRTWQRDAIQARFEPPAGPRGPTTDPELLSSPVLRQRRLDVWPVAGTIGMQQLLAVERHAPKLQRHRPSISLSLLLLIRDRQDGVLGPRIGTKDPIRLMMAVRQADAARIEEEAPAQPPDLLRVRVAAGQDVHVPRLGVAVQPQQPQRLVVCRL